VFVFTSVRLWSIFVIAGAVGWFGWPRSRFIGIAGLALGLVGAAPIAEDLLDGLDLGYLSHVALPLAVFLCLHAFGLHRRRESTRIR
jgi:hypothetical protein